MLQRVEAVAPKMLMFTLRWMLLFYHVDIMKTYEHKDEAETTFVDVETRESKSQTYFLIILKITQTSPK